MADGLEFKLFFNSVEVANDDLGMDYSDNTYELRIGKADDSYSC